MTMNRRNLMITTACLPISACAEISAEVSTLSTEAASILSSAASAAQRAAATVQTETQKILVTIGQSPLGAVQSWQQILGLAEQVLNVIASDNPAVAAITGLIEAGAAIFESITSGGDTPENAVQSIVMQTADLQSAVMAGLANFSASPVKV